MLPAKHRMRRPPDFAAAVRRGRRSGRAHLVVHLLEQAATPQPDGEPTALVGFVVSKAVGTAAVRNRVQRRLRHLLRDRLTSLPPGCRVVVRALPPSASATSAQLATDLDAALRSVNAPRGSRRRPEGARS